MVKRVRWSTHFVFMKRLLSKHEAKRADRNSYTEGVLHSRRLLHFSCAAGTLHYKKKKSHFCVTFLFGDPDETRTRVTAVKGRCLNRLTTGPYIWKRRTRYPALFIVDLVAAVGLEPTTLRVWTECSSQLSYAAICHAAFTTLEYNITTFYICQAFFESFFIFFLLFFISLYCLCFR